MKKNSVERLTEGFEQLKDDFGNKITFGNIVNLITKSIEIVEQYGELNGMQKKTLVIELVCLMIDSFEEDKDVRESLKKLVDTIGYNVIDAIIFATKGKMAVNLKRTCKRLNCLSN